MGQRLRMQELNIYNRIPPGNNGCDEHNDCLTCPLSECIHIISTEELGRRDRKKQVRFLRKVRYYKPYDIATELGICRTTVYEDLKE